MIQQLDIGFIILSTDLNLGRLKSTKNSISAYYGDVPVICVAHKSAPAEEYKRAKDICDIFKGKDTITSLINTGFKSGHKAWNILVMEGTWIRNNLDRKYSYFIESEKDILYPVVTDYDLQGKPVKIHNNFWDCSLNGIMIHQKTFKEVGNLEDGSLENARLIWSAEAQEKGCKFKAILGAKLC